MAKRLKEPEYLNMTFKPSPKQYEMWKLVQPQCHICGGDVAYECTGSDSDGNKQYVPLCQKCGNDNVPQIILAGREQLVRCTAWVLSN